MSAIFIIGIKDKNYVDFLDKKLAIKDYHYLSWKSFQF